MDKNSALWLPPGSIRAIIGIVVVVAWIGSGLAEIVIDNLGEAALLIIGVYYGSKNGTPSTPSGGGA